MRKPELVEKLAEKADITQKDASKYVTIIFNEMASTLENGEDVIISNFGSFTVTERAARQGHNPSTGETIEIPASKGVKFKASSVLKKNIK